MIRILWFLIEFRIVFVGVCTGSVHTVMLTEDGRVFTCGKASYVGHGQRQNTLTPLWLNRFNNQKIIKISVATGGFHTLALTENRQIYTWGHNRVGQLGLFSADMERYDDGGLYLALPAMVPNLPENIIDVSLISFQPFDCNRFHMLLRSMQDGGTLLL